MTFQYIGNDRYKIYLDRIPARSIRLTSDEIGEIATHAPDIVEELQELKDELSEAKSELKDIETNLLTLGSPYRELEEAVSNLKNKKDKEYIESILEELDAIWRHL